MYKRQGGTHVKNTAQIGCFKILSEASVAAGIRRIEATTGYGVLNLLDDRTAELANTAVALKANNMKDVAARAQAVTAELKEANKQLEIAKAKLASSQIDGLFQNAVEVDGVRIVTVYLNGTTPDTLRSMMDKLRDKEPNAVGALIGTDGSKTTLAVGVGKSALKFVKRVRRECTPCILSGLLFTAGLHAIPATSPPPHPAPRRASRSPASAWTAATGSQTARR